MSFHKLTIPLLALFALTLASSPTNADFRFGLSLKAGDDHDHEHDCPEVCMVKKDANMKCRKYGGKDAMCNHDGEKHECTVEKKCPGGKKGKKWACSCDCDECGPKCPDKCFTAGNKKALAKKSCTMAGKRKTCAHEGHEDKCVIEKCMKGGKMGFACTCPNDH